jgi:arylsulfatase A-like enzyme
MWKTAAKIWILGAIASFGCAQPDPLQPLPNVVLITIDALRADFVSYAGHPNPTSPKLDQFAHENVIFTQAVTSFPGTAPSMPSLMTGLHPSFEGVEAWTLATRHGFNEFESAGEREFPGLSDNLRMLAEILSDNGYQTLGFHTNPHLSASTNFHQGFNEYEQFLPYLEEIRNNRDHPLLGTYPPAPVVTRRVLERLDEGFGQPVFIWIHLMEPHSPYLPPHEYARLFDRTDTGLSDLEINESLYHLLYTQQGSLRAAKRYPAPQERGLDRDAFVDHLLGLYEGEIRYLDDQLHRLFEGLRQRELWEDTLIMVTADHGEEFLDHGHVAHHPFTGLAEELIRIPLTLKPPNGEPDGVVIDDLVRMVDFAPTILDYTGLSADAVHMEGVSLRPLIEGRELPPLTAFYSTIDYNIVRDSRWKYRFEKSPSDEGPAHERLYDLVADPMEQRDVADLNPEIVERMRRRYQEFALRLTNRAPPSDASPIPNQEEIDREELERLEALGYVTD